MNEPSFPTTLPPLNEFDRKPKTPVLGIASFVAAIIQLLSVCAFFIFAYYLGSRYGGSASPQSISAVGWVFICLAGLAGVVGVGLGIAAVVQKNTSKVFGILGLVMNSLVLLGFCVFIVVVFGVVIAAMGSSF